MQGTGDCALTDPSSSMAGTINGERRHLLGGARLAAGVGALLVSRPASTNGDAADPQRLQSRRLRGDFACLLIALGDSGVVGRHQTVEFGQLSRFRTTPRAMR